MDPKPDYGYDSYKGSGKLKGKVWVPTVCVTVVQPVHLCSLMLYALGFAIYVIHRHHVLIVAWAKGMPGAKGIR